MGETRTQERQRVDRPSGSTRTPTDGYSKMPDWRRAVSPSRTTSTGDLRLPFFPPFISLVRSATCWLTMPIPLTALATSCELILTRLGCTALGTSPLCQRHERIAPIARPPAALLLPRLYVFSLFAGSNASEIRIRVLHPADPSQASWSDRPRSSHPFRQIPAIGFCLSGVATSAPFRGLVLTDCHQGTGATKAVPERLGGPVHGQEVARTRGCRGDRQIQLIARRTIAERSLPEAEAGAGTFGGGRRRAPARPATEGDDRTRRRARLQRLRRGDVEQSRQRLEARFLQAFRRQGGVLPRHL